MIQMSSSLFFLDTQDRDFVRNEKNIKECRKKREEDKIPTIAVRISARQSVTRTCYVACYMLST